jgi:hypothetical protein
MHNKFIIIDDEAIITGSLNFTKQVRANFEGNRSGVCGIKINIFSHSQINYIAIFSRGFVEIRKMLSSQLTQESWPSTGVILQLSGKNLTRWGIFRCVRALDATHSKRLNI